MIPQINRQIKIKPNIILPIKKESEYDSNNKITEKKHCMHNPQSNHYLRYLCKIGKGKGYCENCVFYQ